MWIKKFVLSSRKLRNHDTHSRRNIKRHIITCARSTREVNTLYQFAVTTRLRWRNFSNMKFGKVFKKRAGLLVLIAIVMKLSGTANTKAESDTSARHAIRPLMT